MLDVSKISRYFPMQLKLTRHTDNQGKTISFSRRKKMAMRIVKQIIRSESRFDHVLDSGD